MDLLMHHTPMGFAPRTNTLNMEEFSEHIKLLTTCKGMGLFDYILLLRNSPCATHNKMGSKLIKENTEGLCFQFHHHKN